ncbi:hypothetical protein BTHE68_56510 [Burkholderia sp. THE68]|nr:hypothetical protein BTHE68_56510 [Burkholderia sp. THE68]
MIGELEAADIVICMFGERLGTPVPQSFPVRDYLPGLPPKIKHAVDGTDQLEASEIPLTGTLFELLYARSLAHGKKVFLLVKCEDRRLLSRAFDDPLQYQLGAHAWWDIQRAGEEEAPSLVKQDYFNQLNWLIAFLNRIDTGFGWDEFREENFEDRIREVVRRSMDVVPSRAVGLKPKDVTDKDSFFGRQPLLDKVTAWLARAGHEHMRLGLFSGVSGIGKSSLLRAGLLGSLQEAPLSGSKWHVPILIEPTLLKTSGQEKPFLALSRELRQQLQDRFRADRFPYRLSLAEELWWSDQDVSDWLAANIAREELLRRIEFVLKYADSKRSDKVHHILVGFDQLEEVVADTLRDIEHGAAWAPVLEFLSALSQKEWGWLVATIPTDWKTELDETATRLDIDDDYWRKAQYFVLRDIDDANIDGIIRLHLKTNGVIFDDDVVSEVSKEIENFKSEGGGASFMPLLSLTLDALVDCWKKLANESTSVESATTGIGDRTSANASNFNTTVEKTRAPAKEARLTVESARSASALDLKSQIQRLADRAFEAFSKDKRGGAYAAFAVVDLLRQMVDLGDEKGKARMSLLPRGMAALPTDASRSLAEQLVKERLMMPEGSRGELKLSHEAILRHWHAASEWLAEERQLLRIRNELSILAGAWVRFEKASNTLLKADKHYALPDSTMAPGASVENSEGNLTYFTVRDCEHVWGIFQSALEPLTREYLRESLRALDQLPEDAEERARAFCWMASGSDTALIHHYLKLGASIRLCTTKNRRTAFHAVAFTGNSDILSVLLAEAKGDKSILDAQDSDGFTALMIAAWCGNVTTVDALLAAGADPWIQRDTSLHAAYYAINEKNTRCLESLLHHTPELAALPGPDGDTILIAAARQGSNKIVSKLLKEPYLPHACLMRRASDGSHALDRAVKNGHFEVARQLIDTEPRLLGLLGQEDRSILMTTVGFRRDEFLALFMEKRYRQHIDISYRRPQDHANAFDWAVHLDNLEYVRILIEVGREADSADDAPIESVDKNGVSATWSHYESLSAEMTSTAMLEALRSAPLESEEPTQSSDGALHIKPENVQGPARWGFAIEPTWQWETVEQAALSRLADAIGVFRKDMHLRRALPAGRPHEARTARLLCMPDIELTEVLYRIEGKDVPLVRIFLCDANTGAIVTWLNGQSDRLHWSVARGFVKVTNAEAAAQHIELFCRYVAAEKGPFCLLRDASQLPSLRDDVELADSTPAASIRLTNLLLPKKPWKVGDSFRLATLAIYGGVIFASSFTVQCTSDTTAKRISLEMNYDYPLSKETSMLEVCCALGLLDLAKSLFRDADSSSRKLALRAARTGKHPDVIEWLLQNILKSETDAAVSGSMLLDIASLEERGIPLLREFFAHPRADEMLESVDENGVSITWSYYENLSGENRSTAMLEALRSAQLSPEGPTELSDGVLRITPENVQGPARWGFAIEPTWQWETVEQTALSRLADAIGVFRKDMHLRRALPAGRPHEARTARLLCMPDIELTEVLYRIEGKDAPLVRIFLCDANTGAVVTWLNGQSARLHWLVRRGFTKVASVDEAAQYTELFCRYVAAEKGPFCLLRDASQLPSLRDDVELADGTPAKSVELTKLLFSRNVWEEGDNFRMAALVIYNQNVLVSLFALQCTSDATAKKISPAMNVSHPLSKEASMLEVCCSLGLLDLARPLYNDADVSSRHLALRAARAGKHSHVVEWLLQNILNSDTEAATSGSMLFDIASLEERGVPLLRKFLARPRAEEMIESVDDNGVSITWNQYEDLSGGKKSTAMLEALRSAQLNPEEPTELSDGALNIRPENVQGPARWGFAIEPTWQWEPADQAALSGLADAIGVFRKDMHLRRALPAGRPYEARTAKLLCLPDVELVEVLYRIGGTDTPLVRVFLCDAATGAIVTWLNGQAARLHWAAKTGLIKIASVDEAAQYAELFCRYVTGEDGPFCLLRDTSQLPSLRDDVKLADGTPATPVRLTNLLFPKTLWRDGDNLRLAATVIYGKTVFASLFTVQCTSDATAKKIAPEMNDDHHLSRATSMLEVCCSLGLLDLAKPHFDGSTGLERRAALGSASEKRHLDVLKWLLQSDPHLLNPEDAETPGALTIAAGLGALDAVNLLLSSPYRALANPGRQTTNGQHALERAAAGGHVDVVRRLLVDDPTLYSLPGERDRSILAAAVKSASSELIDFLLEERFRRDEHSRGGTTDADVYALGLAIDGGKREIALRLVRSFTDFANRLSDVQQRRLRRLLDGTLPETLRTIGHSTRFASVIERLTRRGSGACATLEGAEYQAAIDACSISPESDESIDVSARWLSCIPDGLFLQYRRSSDASIPALANGIYCRGEFLLLDGTTVCLDFAAEDGWLRWRDEWDAADLLRLHLMHRRVEQDISLPLEDAAFIPWRADRANGVATQVLDLDFGPMTIDLQRDGTAFAQTFALCGDELVNMQLKLLADGSMSIGRCERLARALPVFSLRNAGSWWRWE